MDRTSNPTSLERYAIIFFKSSLVLLIYKIVDSSVVIVGTSIPSEIPIQRLTAHHELFTCSSVPCSVDLLSLNEGLNLFRHGHLKMAVFRPTNFPFFFMFFVFGGILFMLK